MEFALPPLSLHLAKELIARFVSRSYSRGKLRGVDVETLALTLVKVSQIIIDIDEIAELSMHLLLDLDGVLAMDTRIRALKNRAPAGERLAIRPYPKELEAHVILPDGRTFQIRPIRPEDEPVFQTLFSGLSALVIAAPADAREQELYAHVQLLSDPDNERGEFSILVRSDISGKGIGRMLMHRIIAYARSRGIKEIFGNVLSENRPMLRLAEGLHENPGSVIVSLKL